MGQTGRGSKIYRAGTVVPHCISITPADPSASKIDMTDLDSTVKEFEYDLPDLGEWNVKFRREFTDAQQNLIETDFASQTTNIPEEEWKVEVYKSGVLARTYTFTAKISGCVTGPMENASRLEMTVKLQVNSAISIA